MKSAGEIVCSCGMLYNVGCNKHKEGLYTFDTGGGDVRETDDAAFNAGWYRGMFCNGDLLRENVAEVGYESQNKKCLVIGRGRQ